MPLELAVEQIEQSWERLRQGQSTFSHLRLLKISRTFLQGLQDDCAKVGFADRAHKSRWYKRYVHRNINLL